jgi:hypothetical protein
MKKELIPSEWRERRECVEEVGRLVREADGIAGRIAFLLGEIVTTDDTPLHVYREVNVLKALTESLRLGIEVDWLDALDIGEEEDRLAGVGEEEAVDVAKVEVSLRQAPRVRPPRLSCPRRDAPTRTGRRAGR